MQIFQSGSLHPSNKTFRSCLHKESIFFVISQKRQRFLHRARAFRTGAQRYAKFLQDLDDFLRHSLCLLPRGMDACCIPIFCNSSNTLQQFVVTLTNSENLWLLWFALNLFQSRDAQQALACLGCICCLVDTPVLLHASSLLPSSRPHLLLCW